MKNRYKYSGVLQEEQYAFQGILKKGEPKWINGNWCVVNGYK